MRPRPGKRLLIAAAAVAASAVVVSFHGTHAQDGQTGVATLAREILNRRCYSCHGENGLARKNVFVLDRPRLLATRVVIPGDSRSLLLRMVESGAMPEGGPALPSEEQSTLRRWILDGAADWEAAPAAMRSFVDEGEVLALIDRDLLAQPARTRQFMRYFSLVHLYNSGVSEKDLEVYRAALSKLVNGLSWHREINRPAAIDDARTLFRIDLRDYNWTSASWDLLLSAYPYGVRSAESNIVAQLSAARAPYLRADWFVFNASVPPLYHELLELPRSAPDLERLLGVDAERDLAEEANVARAGLRASGVSRNNRVLERHASAYGAYWKSFDFRGSTGRENIFQHPLGFNAAGSELIFNLPNGLQGYMVVDASGRRIDEAPIAIVSDRTNPDDPVIRTGRSCMSCHYDGIREFRDAARAAIQATLPAVFDREKALALYPSQTKLDQLIENDSARFRAAVSLASSAASSPRQEPVNALARRFAADLSTGQAAAEIGLEESRFREALAQRARLKQLGYAQLLVAGGAIKRDTWERNFDELLLELGVGRPIDRAGPLARRTLVADIERRSPVAAAGATPTTILRAAKTIFVSSMTMFLKPDQLKDELRKRPEFEALGLAIVNDPAKADLMIDLDRPVFTYIFTYSVSGADSRIVVATGKVVAFDGNLAAPKIAKELLKRIGAARAETPSN